MTMNHIIIGEKMLEATKVCSVNYHCDTHQFDTGSPFFAHKLFNHSIYDENPANALAKVLIELIEMKYIIAAQINISDYNPNEDYLCFYCGKEVHERILYCSEACTIKGGD